MQVILELQTPLQDVMAGSGCNVRMQICPTYPSELATHTSLMSTLLVTLFWRETGAAQERSSPALVFRMGSACRNCMWGNFPKP
jgi:hypothetical protein